MMHSPLCLLLFIGLYTRRSEAFCFSSVSALQSGRAVSRSSHQNAGKHCVWYLGVTSCTSIHALQEESMWLRIPWHTLTFHSTWHARIVTHDS